MKKEYKVITGRSGLAFAAEVELTEKVNDSLSNGWELQGGVSTMYDNSLNGYYFFQAVVREVKE